jgi:hypothetical protein
MTDDLTTTVTDDRQRRPGGPSRKKIVLANLPLLKAMADDYPRAARGSICTKWSACSGRGGWRTEPDEGDEQAMTTTLTKDPGPRGAPPSRQKIVRANTELLLAMADDPRCDWKVNLHEDGSVDVADMVNHCWACGAPRWPERAHVLGHSTGGPNEPGNANRNGAAVPGNPAYREKAAGRRFAGGPPPRAVPHSAERASGALSGRLHPAKGPRPTAPCRG